MFRRILVPLDGSTFSEAALPAALTLARASNGEVRLLTVVEVPPVFVFPEYRSPDRENAEKYLAGVSERVSGRAGGEISTWVREGYIASEIVAEANGWNADLIVMATHGRGGFSRLWLGSIADAALRGTKQPLLLVRPPESGATDPTADFETSRVLVPLDGSELAEAALPAAISLAKALRAPIELLRVVTFLSAPDLPMTLSVLDVDQKILNEEQKAAEEYVERIALSLRGEGVSASGKVVAEPRAERAILNAADGELIVMATHGRTGLDRVVLGSVADKVVRGARGAVAVIRGAKKE